MIKFRSKIYKVGINPAVEPPKEALDALFAQAERSKGPIRVRGRLGTTKFLQTLVRYRGAWRLYINGPMLKSSGLKVGDVADIEIEFDPGPREVPMHPALVEAFRKDPKAGTAFSRLTPSRQKEILRYVGSLKTEAAIKKNVLRVVSSLRRD
jgi:hypothetical protein